MNNLYDANNPNNKCKQMIQHNIKLHKVNGRDNHKWSWWRRGCVNEVPSLWGKHVFVGAVWRHNAPQEATRAIVFSSHPHTMRDAMIPLVVPLKAATEPLQTRLGQSPQLDWRLPTIPWSFTTVECGSEVTSTVRVLKQPRVTRSSRD